MTMEHDDPRCDHVTDLVLKRGTLIPEESQHNAKHPTAFWGLAE